MLKTHNTLENEFGFILRWKGEIENMLWWRRSYSGGLFKERAVVLTCQNNATLFSAIRLGDTFYEMFLT